MVIIDKIIVEKETVSDTEYTISEVHVKCGEIVKKGQIIFSFETSKTYIDLECHFDGQVIHDLNEKIKVLPGEIVALIVDNATNDEIISLKKDYFSKNEDSYLNNIPDIQISKGAIKLIHDHGLTINDFKGKKLIKEKDVRELIEQKEGMNSLSFDLSLLGNFSTSDVIIIGGGGGAKMVIDAIRSTGEWNIKGIVDSALTPGKYVMDVKVLGGDSLLLELLRNGYKKIVLSFSMLQNLKARSLVYQKLKAQGFEFPNVIHKTAVVEPSAQLGEANIVLALAMLGSEVKLGNANYINTGSLICHEAKIGNNNHFAPNSVIAGRVKVEDNVLVGICATTYFDISISSNSIINNGVNVRKHVPPNTIMKI
jgi:sugar O-acyltransferase (sialic acid O-acetyltransferase NeuD family)